MDLTQFLFPSFVWLCATPSRDCVKDGDSLILLKDHHLPLVLSLQAIYLRDMDLQFLQSEFGDVPCRPRLDPSQDPRNPFTGLSVEFTLSDVSTTTIGSLKSLKYLA